MPKKQKQKQRKQVPGVLWRLFQHRAKTLSQTIISLLPSPSPSPHNCHCKGTTCLGCSSDPKSFLVRPDDPPDYRKLLDNCYVVVSEKAPPVTIFVPDSHCSQDQILESIIDLLYAGNLASHNVLCSEYDKKKRSSPNVKLLSCASWCRLLSRVGDDFMAYLLRETSIFLPAPHGKHYQVAGRSISSACFDWLKKRSLKFDNQHPSLHKCVSQKRKRYADLDDTEVKKQKRYISCNTDGSVSFASNLGLTDKSSMQLSKYHESRSYDVSVSEAPKSTRTATVTKNAELEGKPDLNCITTRTGKRSRPCRWKRLRCKRQKQSTVDEENLNIPCNLLPADSYGLHANFQHVNSSLSCHEKMLQQCSCCLILHSLPTVPKRTYIINRKYMFYNLESSQLVLPKKHTLLSMKPNLGCSKDIIHDIFGFSVVNDCAQAMSCSHSSGSCLIDSACLYHSLVKWFKNIIRRARCCQSAKFLDKHCPVQLLDQHTNEICSSKLEDNVAETCVNKKSKSMEFDTQHCADTVEVIGSQCEAFKSYCSKSQVVSFIWAVSRSILPSELLGTPSNWRIMRRNISKFIQLRRFERFHLKLCLHGLKTSRFPFLSNKYFLSSQNVWFLKYLEKHDNGLHSEFKNWNNDVHSVKRKLLKKWIFWYYSFLVVPLVQANFYVTESQQGKQDIYYYKKPVWEKLTKSTIACFKGSKYSHLDDAALHDILIKRPILRIKPFEKPFGFSKLRLQPKENGVRMVANLKGSSRWPLVESSVGVRFDQTESKEKHEKTKFTYYRSVNCALHDAHTILKGIQFKEPERLGSSVFNYNDVYKRLCPFLVSQKKGLTPMSSLFIVTSDVLKAFDSIDQEKLLNIMKDVLRKNACFLKQYDQVICTENSLWVQKKIPMLNETSNTGYAQFRSVASFRHAVVFNQELRFVDKEFLLSNLTEHVKRNVLLFDGKFYKQCVGISQGGILSSLLCSLYYGHLENDVIYPFCDKTLKSEQCKENNSVQTNLGDSSPCYLLTRFIDDFFFISNSKKLAAVFFSRMKRGFRGYNCYMNDKKFCANFDAEQTPDPSLNRVYIGGC